VAIRVEDEDVAGVRNKETPFGVDSECVRGVGTAIEPVQEFSFRRKLTDLVIVPIEGVDKSPSIGRDLFETECCVGAGSSVLEFDQCLERTVENDDRLAGGRE
jgi:hypothetical protein